MHGELQFFPKFLQQFDIAATPVPKHKVRAYADALERAQIPRQSSDELLAGLLAELFIKVDE